MDSSLMFEMILSEYVGSECRSTKFSYQSMTSAWCHQCLDISKSGSILAEFAYDNRISTNQETIGDWYVGYLMSVTAVINRR